MMDARTPAPLRATRVPGHYPTAETDDGLPIGILALAIAASIGIVGSLIAQAGLSVRLEPRMTSCLLIYAGIMAALAGLSRFRPGRHARAWRDGALYIALFASVSIFGALASYPIAASSHGFYDHWLVRFDHAIGFDWFSWYALIASHPMLQAFERGAYESIFVLPVVILVQFAVTGQRAAATRFIAAFWLSAIITLAAFYLMPMRGPFALMLNGGAVPYVPISARYQAQIIAELRGHQLRQVDLEAMKGLVGAPSFHAASAVLFAVAGWSSRALRWPVAATSAAMLLATPIEGTHYLGDVLAGAVVAIVAVVLTVMIEGRFRHSRLSAIRPTRTPTGRAIPT